LIVDDTVPAKSYEATLAIVVDIVIAVNSTSGLRTSDQLNAPWQTADQIMGIMMQLSNDVQLKKADVVITPGISNHLSSDFQGLDSVITKGELATELVVGEIKKLITKPKMTAFGLNWQHCNHTVYFPTFSFEQYYQSIRRFWRFGQTKSVTVDLVYSDGQKKVLDSLKRKESALKKKFIQEQIKIQLKFDSVRKSYDSRADTLKRKYDIATSKVKNDANRHLTDTVNRIKREMHDELERRSNVIKSDFERRLVDEIKEREMRMREKFEQEYRSKLETEMKKKAADMEKKKAVLEKHIMEQAKKLFS